MPGSEKLSRVCPNGHQYYKSSKCPVCPVCEKERIIKKDFLSVMAAPARRALEREGIKNLTQLSRYREAELLKLHGMGPVSLPKLRALLKAEGLSFRK